jgi:hypothetical protein
MSTKTDEKRLNKKLEEYTQSSFLDFSTTKADPYSHSIELYDALPKYVWRTVERIEGKFLLPIERKFVYRNCRYTVALTPARIKDETGVYRDHFPSQREELVEDALRKLSSDGHGVYLQAKSGDEHFQHPMASVVFTLYELRQELKRMGHGYDINEIKEALNICAGTGIRVTSETGAEVVFSHLFETLGLQNREETGNGKGTRCFVRFNLLVTQSIKQKTFRLLNYTKCMSYRRVLSRWFHKRMSHLYRQANIANPYTIKLTTIIRDSGIQVKRLRKALEKVVEALEELQNNDVLFWYKVEKEMDPKRNNKLIEARFILTPHPSFVSESIKINALHSNKSSEKSTKQLRGSL